MATLMSVKAVGGAAPQARARTGLPAVCGTMRGLAMTYRTILTYFSGPESSGRTLAFAKSIATTFDAHLTGIAALPRLPEPDGGGFYGSDVAFEAARQRVDALIRQGESTRTLFEDGLRGETFPHGWRFIHADRADRLVAILDHSDAADLVVVPQPEGRGPGRGPAGDDVRGLIIESGRPVLIVPPRWDGTSVGRDILLAFDGSREAVRAAFDAIPFLQRADLVHIVWVDPVLPDDQDSSRAGDEIAKSLARHGVTCETVEAHTQNEGVGDELLTRARDYGSDLIVTGAFGHRGLREMVFGSVTDRMLKVPDLPVLMSN